LVKATNGDLIDEETIDPGGKEPARSCIEDHNSKEVGVSASGLATTAVTAG